MNARKSYPRLIRTEEEYDAIVDEIDKLAQTDLVEDSPEWDKLELLTLLVKTYDKSHFVFDTPDPIDAIRLVMDMKSLKQTDLVPYIGSKSKVSEILSRKRTLTLSMIRALQKGLDIPADILLGEPGVELPDDAPIEWQKFPFRELIDRGWFGAYCGKIKEARERAEELMRPQLERFLVQCGSPVFARSSVVIRSKRHIDHYSLAAWQARVIEKVLQNPLPGSVFHKPDKDLLRRVAESAFLPDGPSYARGLLSAYGVKLVIEKAFRNTYLDGATMLLKNGTIVIGLTLRHDRLDNFWFTLLHELSHVVLHLKSEDDVFFDDIESDSDDSDVEIDADNLASMTLIPPAKWSRKHAERLRVSRKQSDLLSWANKIKVHPSVLAGRIRFELNDYTLFAHHLGSKVPSRILEH